MLFIKDCQKSSFPAATKYNRYYFNSYEKETDADESLKRHGTPTPSPVLNIEEPEVKLNTDGLRTRPKPMPDMLEEQTFL